MKKILLSVLFLGMIPWLTSAESITYSACDELNRTQNTITIRMKSLSAGIHLRDAYGLYSFQIENVDPDFVIVSNYNQGSFVREQNSLNFQLSVSGDADISIAPWYEPEDDFYFAAMGDPQSGTTVFNNNLENIEVINPYFITISGDLIAGEEIEADHEQSYQTDFFDISDNYALPKFTVPGNHDYRDGLSDYEQFFGDYDYGFDFANTHFSLASSVYQANAGKWDQEDLDWLETDLQSTSQPNKIALFHHPLVSPSWSDANLYEYASSITNAAQVLDDNGTDLIITGHAHGYDYSFLDNEDISTINNGFYQLVTGGGGGYITKAGQYHHANLIHVDNEEISHKIIPKSDFNVTKEELDKNDGTEDLVSINLTNDDGQAWDWLRLKFKISPEIEHVYAQDQNGNYYDFKSNLYEDYLVVFITTNLEIDEEKTITVAKATKMHENVVNTVYTSGEVSYSETPLNSSTEIDLEATTSKNTSTIEVKNWDPDNHYYSWKEVAGKKNVETTYALQNLSSEYLYKVTVNDIVFDKVGTDESGNLNFTYDKEKKNRTFEIERIKTRYPEQIAIAPYSAGGPQVRIFNGEGANTSQFYAYSKNWQIGYNAIWADIDGTRDFKLVTAPMQGEKPLVRIYNENGKKLASKTVFKNNYKKGVMVKAGDIDNNGKDEIIVSSYQGSLGNLIKIYRYQEKKKKLKLISSQRVYSSDFTGGVNVEIADINNDDKEEIIITPHTGDKKMKILKLTKKSKLITIVEKKFKFNYDGLNVATADINKKGRQELIIVPKSEGDNYIRAYRLSTANKLKYLKKKRVAAENKEVNLDVLGGNINNGVKDEVVVVISGDESKIKAYKYNNKNKFQLINSITPYERSGTKNINTALIDLDNDWDLELVTAPQSGTPLIKTYNYKSKKFQVENYFYGYSLGFSGGVNIVNNL